MSPVYKGLGTTPSLSLVALETWISKFNLNLFYGIYDILTVIGSTGKRNRKNN